MAQTLHRPPSLSKKEKVRQSLTLDEKYRAVTLSFTTLLQDKKLSLFIVNI
jgi:hypothetical protein